ncbi:sensory transduction histidine kinase [Methanosarcina horonobensis HB-1 = JCM 15518]|uniref:Sensory transduction histidine kinase n=1 Tax=Methanosarcina horonobensis HB-1 = JCM 15518 TaxID=1434110 RepID=A0A0E3S982_9EURY|nr:hypothetical protein [Methanosarcina horonobensis]AKB78114.1 sensory transduction histidine kinase [Methanosarcina horonobensis HB-1 = JCM 15518]
MVTSKSIAADELDILMKERIAELEKSNQELRAELLERMRSEKAMRKSEEKYRMLLSPGLTGRIATCMLILQPDYLMAGFQKRSLGKLTANWVWTLQR